MENYCNLNCENCTPEIREKEFNSFKEKYKKISGFCYDFVEHSTPSSVLLGLTNRCCLKCTYCFIQQQNLDMTYDIAEKSIEWLLKNIEVKEKSQYDKYPPLVGFFGGEPLLKYDDIIVPLVNKYKDKIDFCITTNGILLDEDKIDFFYKNKINILLSFDGVPEVQNTQRPGNNDFISFDTVLKNIPYLLLRFPNTVMRATVTKKSISYIYKTFLMAIELGFKQITFCPNAFEDWSKSDEKLLFQEFNKIGLYIYKELLKGNMPIKINPICDYFQKIKEACNDNLYFNNNILRCGLGSVSCAVTPLGDIIPCQEKISNPTNVIGNVNTGINADKHKQFLENYFQKINNISCNKGCSDREKLICLSDLCPSRMEDLNYKFSTANCAFTRMATKVSARLYYLCKSSPIENIREYFEEGITLCNQ